MASSIGPATRRVIALLRGEVGQGTVEYLGLLLAVGALLLAVGHVLGGDKTIAGEISKGFSAALDKIVRGS